MMDGLTVRNFKRFAAVDLVFRPLTVLTGLNGTGKSTMIQALLLIRQLVENPTAPVVKLNGPYGLALGEALDVLYVDATEQKIEVRVDDAGASYHYALAIPDERALHLHVESAPRDTAPATLSGNGMSFTYLGAERLGPRDQLDVTADHTDSIGIGTRGEYTAQALALRETYEVRESLRHPASATEHGVITLRTQVEGWLADIVRPVQITAAWPPGITASLIRYQEPGLLGSQIRPANMGFGISYTLPILVSGLLVEPGGVLIVENPEAHLHPAGQSRLGRFLAQVAGSGAQVVVETHSDHVLNGIRLAAVEDRSLDPSDVVIHFFGDGGSPETIELTRRGGLTSWPKRFFDQMEEDLGRLARAKRRTD